jgi:hypothetical protein
MAELDELVGVALKRVAVPGDSAGVADAIRSRLAAGDPGTPAAPPIFGARRWWMLWLGLGLVVAVLLGLGGTLAFGRPSPPVAAPVPTAVVTPSATPTRTATPTATPTPVPPPPAPPAAPEPEPEPVPDTTAPVILSASSSSPVIFGPNGGDTTITAVATDDRGVVAVTMWWSGSLSGSGAMQPAWSYYFDTQPGTPTGSITFEFVAVDAAGNASAPYKLIVPVQ